MQHEYVFDLGQWHRKGETVKKEESKGIFDKVKSLFSRQRVAMYALGWHGPTYCTKG